MAKDKNKVAQNAAPTSVNTEDTLEKVLNNQALTESQSTAVFDLIKKEHDEKAAKEVKSRLEKAIYRVEEAIVQRKRDRKISEEVSNYKTRQLSRMIRFLVGGVVDDAILEYAQTPDDIWKRETLDKKAETITLIIDPTSGEKKTFKKGEVLPAIIDVVDFDNMYDQLRDTLRNRRNKIDEEYATLVKKLELRHGDYYSSSWRW